MHFGSHFGIDSLIFSPMAEKHEVDDSYTRKFVFSIKKPLNQFSMEFSLCFQKASGTTFLVPKALVDAQNLDFYTHFGSLWVPKSVPGSPL